MSLSSWISRLHRGLKTPVPHDSLWAQGLQTLGSRRQPLATALLAAALTVAPGATSDRVQRAANTKDPALALEIADYGYVLESGRLTMQGPAERLLSDDSVAAAYLGGSDVAAEIRRLD